MKTTWNVKIKANSRSLLFKSINNNKITLVQNPYITPDM